MIYQPDGFTHAGRWVIAATIALVAWAFHPGMADAFNRPKWLVLIAGTGIAAACALWSKTRSPVWQSPIVRATWILVAAWGVSTIFSTSIRASFFGIYTRYDGLLTMLVFAIFVTSVVALFGGQPTSLRILMLGVAAGGVGATFYVLVQHVGADPFGWQEPTGGPILFPFGTLGDSTFAGGFIAMSIPALGWFAYKRNWLAIGLLPFCFWAVLLTESRGGLLAIAAAIAVGLLIVGPRKYFRSKQALWVGATLTLLVVVSVFIGREEDILRINSFVQRIELWQSSLSMFADRPIIGQGLDTFYENLLEFRTRTDATNFGMQIADKPHNVPIERLALTGLIGISAYMFFWFTAARSIVQLMRRQKAVAAIFGAGIAAYFGQALFSIDVPPLAMMQYVYVAALAAVLLQMSSASQETPQGSSAVSRFTSSVGRFTRNQKTQVGAGVAIGVLAVTFSGALFYADMEMSKINIRSTNGRPLSEVESKLTRVLNIAPWEPSYKAFAGAVYEREAVALRNTDSAQAMAEMSRAISHYRTASELQPGNIYHLINLSRAWRQIPTISADSLEISIGYWEQAIELDSSNSELRMQYVGDLLRYFSQTNDPKLYEEADYQVTRSLHLNETNIPALHILSSIRMDQGRNAEAAELLRSLQDLATDPSTIAALIDRCLSIPDCAAAL